MRHHPDLSRLSEWAALLGDDLPDDIDEREATGDRPG